MIAYHLASKLLKTPDHKILLLDSECIKKQTVPIIFQNEFTVTQFDLDLHLNTQ